MESFKATLVNFKMAYVCMQLTLRACSHGRIQCDFSVWKRWTSVFVADRRTEISYKVHSSPTHFFHDQKSSFQARIKLVSYSILPNSMKSDRLVQWVLLVKNSGFGTYFNIFRRVSSFGKVFIYVFLPE